MHSTIILILCCRKQMPSIESVKHILKLISNLPPPLLPRMFSHTPNSSPSAAHPTPVTNHPARPSATEKPTEPVKEDSVTPPSQKRKREDDDAAPAPAGAVKSEKEDSPPLKKLRTNGVSFDGSPIPALRISGVTFTSPSVPPSTPDSNGKHAGENGFDAPKKRPKIQLVDMRNALIKYIRQNKKSSDHLWDDSTYLEGASPGASPQDDPVLSCLIQKTDSLLFGLVALWCEEEHMAVENELWRNFNEPYLEHSDWKEKRKNDAYLPCARWMGAGRWNKYISRAQDVQRLWEHYAASSSSPFIASGVALTHWILASAHHWCADAHIRHAAMASRVSYKEEKQGDLRAAEYDYTQDRGWQHKLRMPRSVPKSISAARFHNERSATLLDRARASLLHPGFLASNFPRTWENCTRVPSRPDTGAREAGEAPPVPSTNPPYDPWSLDPLANYKVPNQAQDDAFSFQWPVDLRCPATHLCAFGRSLLYEIGSKAWPMCDAGTRPFGLAVCFTRPKEDKPQQVHSFWQ
ncbi:hypothetical protein CALCODRAFT_322775 [Calocera cornea HHB12733]|uniref:Uncharacterized protein n=1 Tax=Calocera cornea HHB12733 TaxID=1353952 RepID=A0A165F563_9BASI|nr:hypothetical protein CALCODRAFT_322775 [Calocera cornea HHB12733]